MSYRPILREPSEQDKPDDKKPEQNGFSRRRLFELSGAAAAGALVTHPYLMRMIEPHEEQVRQEVDAQLELEREREEKQMMRFIDVETYSSAHWIMQWDDVEYEIRPTTQLEPEIFERSLIGSSVIEGVPMISIMTIQNGRSSKDKLLTFGVKVNELDAATGNETGMVHSWSTQSMLSTRDDAIAIRILTTPPEELSPEEFRYLLADTTVVYDFSDQALKKLEYSLEGPKKGFATEMKTYIRGSYDRYSGNALWEDRHEGILYGTNWGSTIDFRVAVSLLCSRITTMNHFVGNLVHTR